ncbi:MAG: flagellar basal body-associated FliL family protein [Krumholzibacteria bacterium]|nr:flagellar basal body-associated FliL family protein [Candidatus Krumholzibacteria bacterium]
MADEKSDVQEGQAGRRKLAFLENKVLMLGVIVVLQAAIAIGLTQFVILPRLGVQSAGVPQEQGAQEVPADLPALGQLVNLEEMIVTLDADVRKPRYLRINVNLEVRDAAVAKIAAGRVPQLRDIVIMALSTKTVDDLATPAGKKALRDEIHRDIAARMPEGALMNVYFSDLVVQ